MFTDLFRFFFVASLIFLEGGGVTISRNSLFYECMLPLKKSPFVEEELFTLV